MAVVRALPETRASSVGLSSSRREIAASEELKTTPGYKPAFSAKPSYSRTHLYFESIHPFEDGNGRIGRAIAEKTLAQSLGQPTLTALAATILARRKSYYEALEAAN